MMTFDSNLDSCFSISTQHPLCQRYPLAMKPTLLEEVYISHTGGARLISDALRKFYSSMT